MPETLTFLLGQLTVLAGVAVSSHQAHRLERGRWQRQDADRARERRERDETRGRQVCLEFYEEWRRWHSGMILRSSDPDHPAANAEPPPDALASLEGKLVQIFLDAGDMALYRAAEAAVDEMAAFVFKGKVPNLATGAFARFHETVRRSLRVPRWTLDRASFEPTEDEEYNHQNYP